MLKRFYKIFLEAQGNVLHCRAHSHHPWPDITREAHLRYWDDSARLAEAKWEQVLGEVLAEAQSHVARHIVHPRPRSIAFAPNSHELVARLYSCLDWSKPLHIVTTGSEFSSFARQTRRLEETDRVKVTRVAVEPYPSFALRFLAALRQPCDMVFLSHTFFDSGFVVRDLPAIVAAVPERAIIAIDGYHAFMALPVDISTIAQRVFYLGGGYKYAQAGEGACFLASPPSAQHRPIYTGWFAERETGSAPLGQPIAYGLDAMRFWGSTFDASGIYRLNAVMRLLQAVKVDAESIHRHVVQLQTRFLDGLTKLRLAALPMSGLTPAREFPRGNFCAFELSDAAQLQARLAEKEVLVDHRSHRLRFGFGVYHDAADIDRLLERLRTLE